MKIILKIVFIQLLNLVGLTWVINAQTLQIEKISLENVVKNDEQYLRSFIKSKAGDTLSLSKLEEEVQQLNRRTGIAKTSYELDTLENDLVNIRFQVEEQKTLLPQFGLGGIQNNFWWAVGLAEYNLLGREQVLLSYFLQNDGRANFKIYYENARLKGGSWGFAGNLNHASSIEPLYFPETTLSYIYTNTGAGLQGIRHFGFNHKVKLGGDFFQESYQKTEIGSAADIDGPDFLRLDKLLLTADYFVDKIQYDYFYRKGFFYNLKYQFVSTLTDKSKFSSLSFEGKHYWQPIPTGNIALRLRAAIASNNDSPFAPFVLDSRVNIRGVGNRVDRGTAQFVLNLEYRQTLFHKEQWAAQAIAFSDMGTWRNPGGDLKDLFDRNQFRHFIGGGFRIINKKVLNLIARLDYGFDLWNPSQKGFVLGLDQYF